MSDILSHQLNVPPVGPSGRRRHYRDRTMPNMRVTMPNMRVLIAPNAFKGTLTAAQAARAMRRGLADLPDIQCELLPMADGGDGSVDAFVSAGYDGHPVRVRGAHGAWHDASIAVRGDHAVVELAGVCGIALPDAEPLRPLDATTLGVGDAMLAALDFGATHLALCLGGSASTDGGAGLLEALGARLLDDAGATVPPTGRALGRVAHVDMTEIDARLAHCRLEVLADVTNPLHGPQGAAHVFAPQKGASEDDVRLLDAALVRWGDVLRSDTGRDVAELPGSGAAGGAAAALAALGAAIRPGAASIAELIGLAPAVAAADLVIVGEGRLDEQTPHGKAISEVMAVAAHAGVPVLAVCGQITLGEPELRALGLAGWATAGGDGVADAPEGAAQAVADATRTLLARLRFSR